MKSPWTSAAFFLFLLVCAFCACEAVAAPARKVLNIVNFVRAVDPRSPKSNYLETLSNEVALVRTHGFPSTCLLQYDALVDAEMMAEARKFDPAKTEYGLWFEMSRPLNDAAGVPWRGKHDWEYFVNPGFLMAYSHADRRRLIDAAFARFKHEFGAWPKSVGSWMIDAWSMDYMAKTYDVDGFCICREQDSTDAYGLRGGYSNGAYYPSRKNMLSAAVDMENAVPVPVFKMLTPDPIYNYGWPHKLYKGYPSAGGCPTIEPRWYGGNTPRIVDWYFRVYTEPQGLLNLSYMQAGQENSFTWARIEKGWKIQCPKIAAEVAAGRIVLETMGETARAFKSAHPANCPQTQIALEDWTGAGRKSVWYNSRFYRANLVMEGRTLHFRDIHKMCDGFEEPFLEKPCTGWCALCYTPPVVDQWMFRGEGASGTMALSGEFASLEVAPAEGDSLVATAKRTDGSAVEVRFEEGRIAVSGAGRLSAEYEEKFRKSVSVVDGGLGFEFQGYRYRVPVLGGAKAAATEKGFEIGGEKIVLDLSAAELAPEEVRQEFRPARHGRDDANVTPIQPIDGAAWIWHPNVAAHGGAGSAWFVRFVKEFEADASPLRFDVSGDERFVLILDGKPVAFGPHRGFEENWLYQTYEAKLAPGRHVMEAVVWVMGPHAPSAQLHWRGGFILKAEGAYHDKLTTGVADWHVARLRNTKMLPAGMRGAYGVGSECEVRGCSFIDDRPTRPYYDKASVVRGPVRGNPNGLRMPGWLLYPTPLPDQTHERIRPGTFVAARDTFGTNVFYRAEDAGHPAVAGLNALMKEGRPFVVPTNTVLCAVIDLGDYYCAYPELTTVDGKGAEIRWTWAESLKYDRRRKGNRDEFVCKAFLNELSDRFFPDGRSDAFFTTPWWRTGRWCQIEIKTADKPLTIASLSMSETRYPIEVESHFRCDDPSLDDVQRICRRGMEMALHENMCDGPHYEQHQYPGDTLVQAAAMRALTGDGRLAMRAIEIFDHARRDNGMLPMNFPTAGVQESATYTMVWPLMLRDCVMWHETDEKWLKARMPGLLHTIAGIAVYENGEGLLENLPGWCFQDWVPNWGDGVGPGGKRGRGVSAFNNLFYLLAVQAAAEVADTAGDAPLAAYWRGKAEALARRIVAKFMDTAAGVLCDSPGTGRFSEHVQSLAILAGVLTSAQEAAAVKAVDSGRTADGKPLSKATNYFCHYLFGACAKAGRTDIILKRLDHWRAYSRYGLRTPLEDDDFDAKSDCHAWASHPIFHLHSAIAGVTPAEPFFRTVRVAPQPGGLKRIDAATPHPKGLIETRLAFDGDSVSGEVVLPDGVTGEFLWRGKSLPLHGGANKIDMK